ncbi:DUF4435 domain-containing protein [Pantoea ananatis]|uniref:DUF4435 domain-containing protein n=1 Tax=Pantoea ananas TaxID=553 RepID=UPI001B30867C|nr:DUF4435 domain-containing protein [Pantoea ananatis]
MTEFEKKEKIAYFPKNKTLISNFENVHIKTSTYECSEVKTSNSIVIIGANGSGKTRLGTWLDLKSPLWEKSLRISAQKSLKMPRSVQPRSIDEALKSYWYGSENATASHKINNRWQHEKSAIHFLDDFEKLMTYLFSEEMDANAKYTHQSRASLDKLAPPQTKIATLKEIWESLLPHRELIIGGAKIETKIRGDGSSSYNSSEMSDGERVILYHIGSCLSAPENGIIIVDEPEIHIHKSLQYPLWKSLETLRSDCLFFYITHDVEFASSQTDATKIWLKSFDGKSWEWEQVNKEEGFSEDLLLEIMGSRRKVIFVEGDSGSYDISLYRILFPNHMIIPRGSCSKVISDIRTLRKLPKLHHLDIIGIIDRDRRLDDEITSLQRDRIYTLSVAEVENLFCTEEMINFCCDLLTLNHNEKIEEIKKEIFKSFNSEIENQLSLRVISEVKFKLNALDEKGQGSEKIKGKVKELIDNIDIDEIYLSFEERFNKINEEKNYRELLKFYNRKNLKDKVGKILGVVDIPALITRAATKNDNALKIKEAVKSYFKDIPDY